MTAARALLQKLGKAALEPRLVNGRKLAPLLSPRIAAQLRKEDILAGREWPFDDAQSKTRRFGFGLKAGQPKGHKWQKEKQIRLADIEKNMQSMPEKIAAYREHRKLKESSVLDLLLSTPKERRMKQYRLPK